MKKPDKLFFPWEKVTEERRERKVIIQTDRKRKAQGNPMRILSDK